MKKSKFFLSLTLLAMLGLSACAGGKEDSKKPSGSEASEPQTSESETSPEDSTGSQEHVHNMVFDSFVWTLTPGAYTAKAKYVCSANDGHEELHDAIMTKVEHVAPQCEEDGFDTWKASYEEHEETKNEVLEATGHSWGSPEWNWTGLDCSTATATFTCANNNEHTHVETATVENGGIECFEDVAPTCVMDGHKSYRATVTFNNQEYKDEKVVNVPSSGHEDIEPIGICQVCGEYDGTELPDPDMEVPFNNMFAGTYYYRFLHDNHYGYKLVFDGDLQESWFHFYGIINENIESLTLDAASFRTLEETDDDYVYLIITNSTKVNSGSFFIDFECAHIDGPDYYGFCDYCGQYTGMTIEEADFNTEIEMPARDDEEYYYVRVEINNDDHYTLYQNQDYTGHDEILQEFYLFNDDGDPTEITSDNFNGLHTGAPTSIKDYFRLNSLESDGYLYLVLCVNAQYGIDEGDFTITVSTEHLAEEHGMCIFGDGEYLGTTVTVEKFNTDQQFQWNGGKPVFYRFEELYCKRGSDYQYVQYQVAFASTGALQYCSFFYMKGGVWKSFELAESWVQLPEHPDEDNPYIYMVFLYPDAHAHSTSTIRLNYQL